MSDKLTDKINDWIIALVLNPAYWAAFLSLWIASLVMWLSPYRGS